MSSETEDATLQLLTQLAEGSTHRRFLLARLPAVREACQINHALRLALERLFAGSTLDAGRFRFDRARYKNELETFRRFFDYLYYSSDDFLQTVL